MIEYRRLYTEELSSNYFADFKHEQKWSQQWVKQNFVWSLEHIKGSRSWSAEKRIWIAEYLKKQIAGGGFAIGAFQNDQIVGFICIDGKIIDRYANLTMLFVDDAFKRVGIGKTLLQKARKEALTINAKKLFISAIPSEETIAFYFSVGCKDAEMIVPDFVDSENDRYLELEL